MARPSPGCSHQPMPMLAMTMPSHPTTHVALMPRINLVMLAAVAESLLMIGFGLWMFIVCPRLSSR